MNASIFPENFLQSIANAPGINLEKFTAVHQNSPAPTSVRINPFKSIAFENTVEVPWCKGGYYLESRPSFTFDPLFHAGCYYVQEASSMFMDTIYKHIQQDGESAKVLDLCAAPGGKSTLLASLLKPEDLLVSNEIIKTRVPVLSDNLTRWGISNVIVTNNDAKDFARVPGFFDVILVDAPCSGSGMFRKDPEAMEEWSADNVNLCHQRQERILADVYPALREDGYLIYSTCSYSVEENENILDWLCREFDFESIRIPIEADWGIVESQSAEHKVWGYRFYPDKIKGEGLFAACLRKTASTRHPSSHKNKSQKPNFKEIDLVKPYINNSEDYFYYKVGEDWLVIDRQHKDSLETLQQYLYIKKSGVRIGKLAGKDLIPDHELALSLLINKGNILQTELNYDQAIAYLRRDNFELNIQQKGWSLMNYKGHALGWAKLLPNRLNNYYPKELRILAPRPAEGGDAGAMGLAHG